MNRNENREWLKVFASSIATIRNALSVLSPEDRKDAIRSLPSFFHDDPEESAAAYRLIDELFDPPSGGISRLN